MNDVEVDRLNDGAEVRRREECVFLWRPFAAVGFTADRDRIIRGNASSDETLCGYGSVVDSSGGDKDLVCPRFTI